MKESSKRPLKSIWAEVNKMTKKHLKVQWDIYDADEVKEITAAKTPMKKYASVCDM